VTDDLAGGRAIPPDEAGPARGATHPFAVPPVPLDLDPFSTRPPHHGRAEPASSSEPITGSPAIGTPRVPRPTPPRHLIGGAVVAAIALVILVVGGMLFLLLDTNSPTKALSSGEHQAPAAGAVSAPPPTARVSQPAAKVPPQTAANQATAISGLLDQSSTERANAANAITAVGSCAGTATVATAARDLNAAAAARMSLVQSLSALPTDKLPRGRELVGHLSAAWTASAASDRSYSAWAAHAAAQVNTSRACRAGLAVAGSSYRAAQDTDRRATADKRVFVAAWNPLATRLSLPQRAPAGL